MQVSNQFPKDFPRISQISKDFKDYAGDLLNFLGSTLLRTNTPKKTFRFSKVGNGCKRPTNFRLTIILQTSENRRSLTSISNLRKSQM